MSYLKIKIVLVILSLGLPALVWGQAAPVTSPSQNPPPPPPGAPMPSGMQMTNIPYFTLRDGMNSTLTLNNTALSPVPVTVTIYNRQGRSQVLPPITLDPHSFKQIELRDVVASELFDSGSLEISYMGTPMLVTCQLSVYSMDKRVSFESREQSMMDFESSKLNGILSVPDKAEGFLAMTNVASNPVKATLSIEGKTKVFALQPRETQVAKLNEQLQGRSMALVSLQHDGKPGAIVTTGFVLDLKNGYSATFMMHDPKLMRSSILAGAHLRFGRPDPSEGFPEGTQFRAPLLLANVTAAPVNAHVSVDYTVQDQAETAATSKSKTDAPTDKVANVAVKDITIAAGDVQKIELSDEMARFNIGAPVEEAGVEISYDAAPGSLIAQLTSVDQSGDYSFEVPIKDPSAIGEWPQGVYPWTLENGVVSTLHLKNFTDKKQLAQVEIRFAGGAYNPRMLVLAPHQTMAIDIRKLRDSQTPDEYGRVIPAEVTHGQLWWGPRALRTIIGRNEEVNVTQGIASSFSCGGTCCGIITAQFRMVPGSATMGINGNAWPLVSQEQDWTCVSGNIYWTAWYDTSGYYWSSSNTSVANIVGGDSYTGYNPEITTGPNGGTATISASFDWEHRYKDTDLNACTSDPMTSTASAPQNVCMVTVNSADLEANQVNVTLSGGGSGALVVQALGGANTFTVNANGGNPLTAGSYNVALSRPSMPADTYTSVKATWNCATTGNQPTSTLNLQRKWIVLGTIRHSQYNTVYESFCPNTTMTAYINDNGAACNWQTVTLRSQFVSQTENTGTGVSDVSMGNQVLKFDDGKTCYGNKPANANSTNILRAVSIIDGQCLVQLVGGDSTATNPGPRILGSQYNCADHMPLVNSSNANAFIKHIEDQCANTTDGCADGHVDNYSSSQACSARAVGDLPGSPYWTADDQK